MSTISTGSDSILRDVVEGRATVMPWTVEQYHWAISTGFIEETPAYELLDGWIVRKLRNKEGEDPMTIGDRHRLSVQQFVRLAPQFYPHGCYVSVQQPITLPPSHEPEPDAAIIRGAEQDYTAGPPGPADVLCVIEVADASLRRDRGVKLRAYETAGIRLYVIVNLVDDQVEVYVPGDGGYGMPTILKAGAILSLPTAAAGVTVDVSVDRLLP